MDYNYNIKFLLFLQMLDLVRRTNEMRISCDESKEIQGCK